MTVTMSMADMLDEGMRCLRIEVRIETEAALHPHVRATDEEEARHAQSSQALYLAESEGEPVRRRLDAPGHGSQRQDVGREIGQAVPTVRNHSLGVERPSSDELGNGHGKVGDEADVGYAHARIGSVLGDEVGVVMVVMVAQPMRVRVSMVVAMAVAEAAVRLSISQMVVIIAVAGLVRRPHDDGWQVVIPQSSIPVGSGEQARKRAAERIRVGRGCI